MQIKWAFHDDNKRLYNQVGSPKNIPQQGIQINLKVLMYELSKKGQHL